MQDTQMKSPGHPTDKEYTAVTAHLQIFTCSL